MKCLGSLHFLFLLVASCQPGFVSAAGYMDQNTYTTQGQVQRVRRERNLDHWDSDTLAFYLDEYQGFDVAIMFYAQWDSNSRSLAPYWDSIAKKLEAGSSRSRLVMALFDCELNAVHSQLCAAVGVNLYPTLMFVGSGPYYDTDPFTKLIFGSKSAGVFGEAPVPNTVKFQGNWQYVDSITDWIRTMQALSNWHTWSTEGFGKRLRNFFLPHKKKDTALPIGIPGRAAIAATAGAASSTTSQSQDSSFLVKTLENEVEQLTSLTESYHKTTDRLSSMLNYVLVGGSSEENEDMFTLLKLNNAWTKSDEAAKEILRQCVVELSLDYCQRISEKAANDLVADMHAQGMSVDEMLALPDLEQRILDAVKSVEPYCALFDNCMVTDFAAPECRPDTCPFQNPVACQYLNSCMDPGLEQEFAEALGFNLTPEPQAKAESKKDDSSKKKWGL